MLPIAHLLMRAGYRNSRSVLISATSPPRAARPRNASGRASRRFRAICPRLRTSAGDQPADRLRSPGGLPREFQTYASAMSWMRSTRSEIVGFGIEESSGRDCPFQNPLPRSRHESRYFCRIICWRNREFPKSLHTPNRVLPGRRANLGFCITPTLDNRYQKPE
jgi:hypothetical protein